VPIEPKSASASSSRLQNIRSERSSQLSHWCIGRAWGRGSMSNVTSVPRGTRMILPRVYTQLTDHAATRRRRRHIPPKLTVKDRYPEVCDPRHSQRKHRCDRLI
jgi:hypothetical protein